MKRIDTHSHFNLSQFDTDRKEAIRRMENADTATICVGIDKDTSEFAVSLAESYASIYACIGQHPTDWSSTWNGDEMRNLSYGEKVVAIGECGLDYFREEDRQHKEEQRELFISQISLAAERNLPLMLHIRPSEGTMDAYLDALTILSMMKESWGSMRGTAHFFVGTPAVAQEFLDLGFHISFSGVITFVPQYEALVRAVPLNRILSETDAPFAAPDPYRGRRNEPSYVKEIIKKIALCKGVSLEETEAALLENATTLFGIS